MKRRSFICLLLACVLAAYGFEFLPFTGTRLEQAFAYSWLAFCGLVMIGNGRALIKNSKQKNLKDRHQKHTAVKKARQYG